MASGGRKAWTFIFTSPKDGKRARLTLGTYPATSLATARTLALEARGHVEAGNDPRDVLASQEASAVTVKAIVESYLAKHARPNLRTAKAIERRLNKNVVPVIGAVKIAELHRRDVNRVVDPILPRAAGGCMSKPSKPCRNADRARWLQQVTRDKGLTKAAIRVAIGLSDCFNDGRWRAGEGLVAFPKQRDLAEWTGMSRRSVQLGIDQLADKEHGHISPPDRRGRGKSNDYFAIIKDAQTDCASSHSEDAQHVCTSKPGDDAQTDCTSTNAGTARGPLQGDDAQDSTVDAQVSEGKGANMLRRTKGTEKEPEKEPGTLSKDSEDSVPLTEFHVGDPLDSLLHQHGIDKASLPGKPCCSSWGSVPGLSPKACRSFAILHAGDGSQRHR